jgi:hypothetical protein
LQQVGGLVSDRIPATGSMSVEDRKKLLVALRDGGVASAQDLFKHALDQADDVLFEFSQNADTGTSREQFFNAMRDVRLHRQAMEVAFASEVAQRFAVFVRTRGAGGASGDAAELGDSDSMSLVDEGELEETLAINAMIGKARTRYNSALHASNVRFAEVIGVKAVDDAVNPVGPASICGALAAALRELKADVAIRLVILKLFDRHVIGDLNDLYARVNSLMADAGVLPKIKYTLPAGSREARAPARGPSEEAGSGESNDQGARGGGAAHPEAESEILSTLSGLLAARRPGGAPGAPGAGVAAAGPRVSDVELLTALSFLQAGMARAVADTGAIGAESLTPQERVERVKADLLAQLRQFGINQPEQRVATADEDAIDLVSLVFQFVVQDRNLPAPIQAVLCRLQIPYVRVALKDRHLFAQREHPARRLLDAMAVASIAWTPETDDGTKLLARLTAVVDRVIAEYADDLTLFETLLEEFETAQAQQRKRADVAEQRVTETAQGKEKLTLARRAALQCVQTRIAERTLPPFVVHLLQHPWTSFLVLTHLRQGPESREWKTAVNFVDAVIWATQPKSDPADVARLGSLLPQLQAALRLGLSGVGSHEDDAERLVRGLVGVIDAAQRPAAPVAPAQAAVIAAAESVVEATARKNVVAAPEPEPEEPPPPATTAEDDEWLARVRALKVGTWMEFVSDAEHPERAKLSWISTISARFLFVNHKGLKVAERNLFALAGDLRDGRVVILDVAPIFDRALDSIIARLRSESDVPHWTSRPASPITVPAGPGRDPTGAIS